MDHWRRWTRLPAGIGRRSVTSTGADLRSGRPDPAAPMLCNAPFVALDFDPFGNVQACCANALYPLGNVTSTRLPEIWQGDRARELRRAIESDDLSFGCTVCRYRLEFVAGDVPRDYYDQFPVAGVAPAWPQLLSFSLHNTCNLECIMCGGDSSSRIRTRRDGLASLPHVYDDQFFDDLRPFLEHCTAIDMVGGEPFLVREHRRVWDLLLAEGHRPKMSVTTNGTVWNETVEAVLDAFDTTICVSVDGVTPSTFERVRVGASFAVVMDHLERFRSYAAVRGTGVHLSFSLVRQNWFELGAVLRFADERGMEVTVQTVIEPEFGVQRLPTDELRLVVEALELEAVDLLPVLTTNRHVFIEQLGRLRAELDERSAGRPRPVLMEPPGPDNVRRVAGAVLAAGADSVEGGTRRAGARSRSGGAPAAFSRSEEELRRWSGGVAPARWHIAADGRLVSGDLAGLLPPVAHLPAVRGDDLQTVLGAIGAAVDGQLWLCEEVAEADRTMLTLWFGPASRDKQGLIHRWVAMPDDGGIVVLVAADVSMLPASGTVPVAISSRG